MVSGFIMRKTGEVKQMKLKVIKQYVDRNTKIMYRIRDILEYTDDRTKN
jgi:hypothetical protein